VATAITRLAPNTGSILISLNKVIPEAGSSENDLLPNDPEETHHNWVMAGRRTAEAFKAKGYHNRFVFSLGTGHCDHRVFDQTLADTLVWLWRDYQPN
jgi:hypothetical protein